MSWAANSGFNTGLLTLYIQHTSASLLINENYDPDVLVDMDTFFERILKGQGDWNGASLHMNAFSNFSGKIWNDTKHLLNSACCSFY